MNLGRIIEFGNKGDDTAMNDDFRMEDIGVNHQIPCRLLLMVLRGKCYYDRSLTPQPTLHPHLGRRSTGMLSCVAQAPTLIVTMLPQTVFGNHP